MDNKNNNSKKTDNKQSNIDLRALELIKEQAAKTTNKAERTKLLEKFKAIIAGDEQVAKEIHKLYDPDYVDEDEEDVDDSDFDFDEIIIPDAVPANASNNDESDDADEDEDEDEIDDDIQLEESDDTPTLAVQDVASDAEGGVGDIVNDYLESSFVAKQMKQYENDMWDNCDVDYVDMHKNTYEHVFESDKKDVSLDGIKKYKDNLQRYRNSEDSAVAAYRNSFEKIRANESSHNYAVNDACRKKAKIHFRSGFALAFIAALIGLAAGIALLIFTIKFGGHASSKGMDDEYYLFYIAKAIGIALTVFSPVSLIANIFFFNKEKDKSKFERVRAKDPVKKETHNHNVIAQKYAGSLARGIIVFILIVGMIIGSLVFFLPAYKAVEVDSKDYGYTFEVEEDANGEEVAYITGVYDEKMLPEVVTYYYEANIPTEVSRGGKTYNVVGVRKLYNNSIQRLVIGDHIKSIDVGAFVGCNSLKEIVFKDNLTDKRPIYYWFCNSNNYEYSIPSELRKIDYTIVGDSRSMPSDLFKSLSNVTEIKVSGVTGITEGAFDECSSLENLDLRNCDEYITIESGTLRYCTSLKKLTIPHVEFGEYSKTYNVFSYLFGNSSKASNLTEIDVTASKRIFNYVFYGTDSLQIIKLENAKMIGYYNFGNCTSLEKIYVCKTGKEYLKSHNQDKLFYGIDISQVEIIEI